MFASSLVMFRVTDPTVGQIHPVILNVFNSDRRGYPIAYTHTLDNTHIYSPVFRGHRLEDAPCSYPNSPNQIY